MNIRNSWKNLLTFFGLFTQFGDTTTYNPSGQGQGIPLQRRRTLKELRAMKHVVRFKTKKQLKARAKAKRASKARAAMYAQRKAA